MKKIKSTIAILIVAFATTFSSHANEIKNSKSKTKLRAQVMKLVGNRAPFQVDQNSNANIFFKINADDTLEVVSVKSNVFGLGSYIKGKINDKQISSEGLEKGKLYKVKFQLSL